MSPFQHAVSNKSVEKDSSIVVACGANAPNRVENHPGNQQIG